MKLPGAERSIVSPDKVREYLLSPVNPRAKGKAAFFQVLEFTLDEWGVLQSALLDMAQNGLATPGQVSEFGTKYEIHGTIAGPLGRQAVIRTVWIVDAGEDYPRLVTAYPD
jgi:hypothetical protein